MAINDMAALAGAREVRDGIRAGGGAAEVFAAEVTDQTAVRALVAEAG